MSKINLQFGQNDNIYKIFKTLDKIPFDKKVVISLDPKNSIFQNPWWGKQLVKFLEDKNIDYQFVTFSNESYEYIKNYTQKVENKENRIADFGNFLFSKLKKLSSLQQKLFTRRNLSAYFLIFIEGVILFGAFKFFYDLISPSAEIVITPSYVKEPFAYNFEFSSGDEKTSHIHLKYDYSVYKKTLDVMAPLVSVKAKTTPAKGEAIIFNQTNSGISLVAGTKVSTSDGIQFYITTPSNIPAQTDKIAGQTKVFLQALDTDLSGNPIGNRGNILSGTNLLINNLSESYKEKNVYLIASKNFQGGFYDGVGEITQQDIDNLSNIAKEKMTQQLSGYIRQISLSNQNKNSYILPFDKLVILGQEKLILDTKLGSKSDKVKGIYELEIKIPYISLDEFNLKASQFVSKRVSPNKRFIQIVPNSVNFYYDEKKLLSGDLLIVPTKFDAMISYDFKEDSDGYIKNLKERLKSVSIQEAKEILGTYDQIANSSITLSPPWYDKMPIMKSRINITINKKL